MPLDLPVQRRSGQRRSPWNRRLRLGGLALAATVAAGLLPSASLACSRILLSGNGNAVTARTMDLYIPDQARIVVYPRGISREGGVRDGRSLRWTSRYGSVTVNSLGIATSDGINEKGLVSNLLYLHETRYEPRDKRQGISNAQWAQYLLDTSASVSEALAQLDKVQIVSSKVAGREWPLHLSLADASGDSAVIEFINGVKVVHRGKQTAVMTNEPPLDWQLRNLKRYTYFGGSEALPGDIDPASRFVRASAFLSTSPLPSRPNQPLEIAYNLIKNVAVPDGARVSSSITQSQDNWPTLWTTLADSVNRVYYYQSSRSPNLFWIDLSKVDFSAGAAIRSLPGDDISLNGDVSAKLRPLPASRP